MQNATTKFYSLDYTDVRTYLVSLLFVLGNMALPQLCHLIPHGGMMWLPIYFFTLIAAYKFGWKAGLLTAVLSPIINSLLFGMPMPAALPAILLKSVLLAVFAAMAAAHFQKATLWTLLLVVLGYQTFGTLGEWAMKGDFYLAAQDFRIGVPGMLLQMIGGYLLLKRL